MQNADVVIIGGGVIGASVAYHLAVAGCTNVLILEREEQQGFGSTGRSAGGVRAQFSTRVNIEMSKYSIEFFSRFEEIVGRTAGYKPQGYLFIATNQSDLARLTSNVELQRATGVNDVDLVSKEEILSIVPQLRSDDIVGGSYRPADGFVDPNSVMAGFTAGARARGARIMLETEVTGILTDGGRVTGVETNRGRISTNTVVNAAGAWAGEIGRMAGTTVPVHPFRRQIVKTEPFHELPDPLPMVIDMSSGFHCRREGTALLLACPDPEETPGFRTAFDPDFIERALTAGVNRLPVLAGVEVNPRRCWAGLYEVSPDHHAILGRAEDVEGLFLANGFSGHGVMHSPAAGLVVSECILYGECRSLDAAALSVARFSSGRTLEETAVL